MHTAAPNPLSRTPQVSNLDERIKIDTLKQALTRVFNYYGPVLDIIAKSSLKRKGQAFVVFDSEKAVLGAVEEMNGFELYGKQMKVARARTHSDETVKRKAGGLWEEHRRKRLMLKGTFVLLLTVGWWLIGLLGRFARTSADMVAFAPTTDFKRASEDAKLASQPAASNTTAAAANRPAKSGAALVPDEYVRPNKTLFLQNIPKDVDEETLSDIFERFEGFKEVRLVSVRAVAFAEFENEGFAIKAKEATSGMPVGREGVAMKVTYQRQ